MENRHKRPDRVEEGRWADERDMQIREAIQMNYTDPFHVPLNKIPDGMEYFWARDSCMDQPDLSRIPELRKKGWEPVPADRHPDMSGLDAPWRTSSVKGYIYKRGLVLMERPKRYGDLERRQRDELNYKILNSMPGQDRFLDEPSMPTRVISNELTASRGKMFKED